MSPGHPSLQDNQFKNGISQTESGRTTYDRYSIWQNRPSQSPLKVVGVIGLAIPLVCRSLEAPALAAA
jgi:hypothetical protein